MKRLTACLVALALCGPAVAEEQPDAATLQKALTLVQAQRNRALDAQLNAEVSAALFADENAKLKARVKELEAPVPAKDTQPAK